MRARLWIVGAAVLMGLLSACTAAQEEPDLPSLAEAAGASGAAAPPATGTPGPAVTAACPLLSEAEVVQALGHPVSSVREGAGGQDSRTYSCVYGFGDGNATLVVSVTPASAGTPQQVVDRPFETSYEGSLERLADLGDAAVYFHDPTRGWESVTSAKASGSEIRAVFIQAYVAGNQRAGLIETVGVVLDRI